MTWLNAALAFAITFLILSIVASVFVETIHRFAGLREKRLKLLLGQYHDRVLAQFVKGTDADPAQFKKTFLDAMTFNRVQQSQIRFCMISQQNLMPSLLKPACFSNAGRVCFQCLWPLLWRGCFTSTPSIFSRPICKTRISPKK